MTIPRQSPVRPVGEVPSDPGQNLSEPLSHWNFWSPWGLQDAVESPFIAHVQRRELLAFVASQSHVEWRGSFCLGLELALIALVPRCRQ